MSVARPDVRLGLRANLAQFSLLVGVNALVGGMIGQERTVLPLLAHRGFGLTARTAALGLNQGLTWSTTVNMKIDLVGPARRGLAMGLNEAAGYGAVALTALATGFIAARWGLRPQPFFLGAAYAGLGLGLSALFVRETHAHVRHQAASNAGPAEARLSTGQVFRLTLWRSRPCPPADRRNWPTTSMTAWPGVSCRSSSFPTASRSPALVSSDRIGREWLISGGMLLQAAALGLLAVSGSFGAWAAESALLGAGTAMVYPTLLAAIGDVGHPTWRASAVGVYRLWRDLGFAVGALLAGVVADLLNLRAAIWTVAVITAAAGVVVAVRMYETHRPAAAGERRLARSST